MAVENFLTGSLIIPMDERYQNRGMWLAYGLVYKLLKNGIHVKWAIQPGKSYNGTDFTASSVDILTNAVINSYNYIGGPFIIDSSSAAAALVIINGWQSSYPQTTVHRATAGFAAPIASTMTRVPRISIEQNNSSIAIGYLNTASIPDSTGVQWTSTSPDVLTADEIGQGAFFGYNETDPCKFLVYDVFLSSHTDPTTWSNPVNAAQLDTFLKIGGLLHATCLGITAIENVAGPFLTVSGIPNTNLNQGENNTFTVNVPDFPSVQAVNTSGAIQRVPFGLVSTWMNSGVTYRPYTQVLAYFTEGGQQYDFMIAGPYKGGTGAGKIVYEGGHSYSISVPYSSNQDGPYVRFFYDTIFFSIVKPYVMLKILPRNVSLNSSATVNFIMENPGGSDAEALTVVITLQPWIVYNNDANINPAGVTTGGGGETIITWDVASLSSAIRVGNIINFTAVVTPPSLGTIQAATYNASFSDDFGETYQVQYCASLQVIAAASPSIQELPAQQTVHPNDVFNWTIVSGNNGVISLNNVEVTKVIPRELIYVSAIPSPISVVGGGVSPTTLTWRSPNIPATLNAGAVTTITLNVKAPPATTQSYSNTATLVGTDTSPASYSVSTNGLVDVVNRIPVVTIVNPNGGELICSQTSIVWTAYDPDGDSLTYTVQYSSDAGVNYTTITSGISALLYFWDVTSLPSGNNYLVRVIATDGQLTGSDVSNGTFSIDTTPPTIAWVTPANGALLDTSPINLSAQATDNVAVANVTFRYSQDGVNFNTIGVSNIGIGNIYSTIWNISAVTQGNYTLRAIAEDTCGRISSNDILVTVNFPPDVTIISPNGGEVFCSSPVSIVWTNSDTDGGPTTYSIEYSSNGGTTFIEIASALTSSPYSWNTTSLLSGSNYLIKIIANDGISTGEDISNGTFTIDNTPPNLFIVTPTNGSTINTFTETISANATDNIAIDNVVFQYSEDGVLFMNIATETLPSSGNIYTTTWNLSGLIQGNYIIRVIAEDTCGKTTARDINVLFNITPQVTLISPNGGELFCTAPILVTWSVVNPDQGPVSYSLLYSENNGITYDLIIGGLTGTSYSWNTATVPSGSNYLIKVIVSDGISTSEDVSNGTFTIDNTPPTIDIISPSNGATINSLSQLIQADTLDDLGINNVLFQYSRDGINFTEIAIVNIGVGNVYSTTWNLTGLSQGNYTIRATATDLCGKSTSTTINVRFIVPPSVQILNPNGGEVICSSGTIITWTASSIDGSPLVYNLLYSNNNGLTYNFIATGITTNFYNWNTSGLSSGNEYLIKVIASDGFSTSEDSSNGTFTIDNTPPTISILTPTNGTLINTTSQLIQARVTDNVAVSTVLFQYSHDGGTTFHDIGTAPIPVNNIYVVIWDLSLLVQGNYIIRVRATDECDNLGLSDINVIYNLPPTVTLLAPNGGEIICPQGFNITWQGSDEDYGTLTYSLLYSLDRGVNFIPLASGLTGSSYFWDTSGLPNGNEYLVKIIANDGISSVEDVSDNTFTLDSNPPSISWIEPIEGSYLKGTVNLIVRATDIIDVNNVKFLYSLNSGATFIEIGIVTVPVGDNQYIISLNTTTINNGACILKAIAEDDCNLSSEAMINVTIDNIPPIVTIQMPNNGATVNGIVSILVTASDTQCLEKVELYIDGVLVDTKTGEDIKNLELPYLWDTNNLTEGQHEIEAIATDCAGLTSSTVSSVLVDNLPDCYSQIIINEILVVPTVKPDIEQVVNVDINPIVQDITTIDAVNGNKFEVNGVIEVGVTYVANVDEQTVHFFHRDIPFITFSVCNNISSEDCVDAVIVKEYTQVEKLDNRSIELYIVLFVGIKQV